MVKKDVSFIKSKKLFRTKWHWNFGAFAYVFFGINVLVPWLVHSIFKEIKKWKFKTLACWFSILALILLGQNMMGGSPSSLIQFTSGVIVIVPVIVFFLFSYGVKGIGAFAVRLESNALNERDLIIVDKAITLGFLLGTIGGIIGLIHVMENLAETSVLGAGIAVSFVTLLYGTLPALFFITTISPKVGVGKVKQAVTYAVVASFILFVSFTSVIYAVTAR